MGGRNKALMPLHGRPLIEHIADRLRPHVCELLISTGTNRYADADLPGPGIADPDDLAGAGPLAGILALLQAMQSDWLLVLPCDAPLFPEDAMQELIAQAQVTELAATMRVNERVNPVCSLLHKRCITPLESALHQKQLRSTDVILSLSPTFVDHDDNRPGLWSINTDEELAVCERQFNHAG